MSESGFTNKVGTVLLGQAGRLVVGALSAFLVAALIGPSSKGVLALVVSLASIYAVIATVGMGGSVTYFAGRGRWSTSMALAIVLAGSVWTGGTAALIGVIAHAFGALQNVRVEWLAGACGAQALSVLLGALLIGEHRFREFSTQTVLAPLLTLLVFGWGLMQKWGSTEAAVWSWIIGNLFSCVPFVWVTLQRSGFKVSMPSELRSAFAYGARSAVASGINVLTMRLDVVLLGVLVASAQTGVYAIAVQFSELMLIVPTSIGYVLFPHVASGSAGSDDGEWSARLCRVTIFLGSMMTVPLVAIAAVSVRLFLAGYDHAVPLLILLLPGTILFTIARIAGNDLFGRGLPEAHIWAAASSLIVTIAGNLLLIPTLGAIGAAATSSAAYAVYAVVIALRFRKATGIGVSKLFVPGAADVRTALDYVAQLRNVVRRSSHKETPSSSRNADSEGRTHEEGPASHRLRIGIVAYHLVPGSAAGAVRPHSLAVGLARCGHEVTVFTAEPKARSDEYRAVVVPHRYIGDVVAQSLGLDSSPDVKRRLSGGGRVRRALISWCISLVKAAVAHPDEYSDWGRSVVGEARKLPPGGATFDVVIGTSPPVSCLYAAREIADISGCPWIADFRDLWTQNPYYPYGRVRRAVDAARESSLLSTAAAIVTVSRHLADQVSHRGYGGEVRTVYTGVELSACGPSDESAGPLKIIHTGNLYDGKRDVGPFVKALEMLRAQGLLDVSPVDVSFFGRTESKAIEQVRAAGLDHIVKFEGLTTRERVRRLLATADVGLLVLWDDPRDAGSLPSKLIEYVCAGLPVIVIGGQRGGEVAKLADACDAIHMCDSPEEVRECLRGLLENRPTPMQKSEVRAFGHARFSMDAMVREYRAVIEDAALPASSRLVACPEGAG